MVPTHFGENIYKVSPRPFNRKDSGFAGSEKSTNDEFPFNPGELFWYGRAELKQSDHRPVLGIVDIEVTRILEDKREAVFEDALDNAGPPDGSVLLQVSSFSVFLRLQDFLKLAPRR
jgi:hypothetical protein